MEIIDVIKAKIRGTINLKQLKKDVTKAGNVLNKARSEIENELGKSIVTSQNYIELTDTLIETK